MFSSIIEFSIKNKPFIGFLVMFLIGYGIYSITEIPIDAVPDITNNQVQVVTSSPSLSPQEVEKFITYPLEITMANIKDVVEIRSVSRYGLSVVTIVFKEKIPILDARQLVNEQISMAVNDIPESFGTPEMLPITTGLGEVYQYTLEVQKDYKNKYNPTELRTIHDWIVKRQLSGIPGIVEISSFGGFLKQYEVAVDPLVLQYLDITINDVFVALENNNENTGGSYIEKGRNTYYIRAEGLIENISEIENIIVKNVGDNPVFIKDIAQVKIGSATRFGAMTKDGQGEAVGGITLMLKDANSSEVIKEVKKRVEEVQNSLPEGVYIKPYLDRSDLVKRTINTVSENLILGGLIVIFILVLLLGHLRSGLIVASVIPLALLFAFIMMKIFGVSANLMSLGAIDFGIVIDGAVIIVENIIHRIYSRFNGKNLSQKELDKYVGESAGEIYKSAAFGVIIILIVFIPIMTLTGIEGKMFKPMAQTFSFAILGAFILSLTYVPMMAALVLKKNVQHKRNFSDKIIDFLKATYNPVLLFSLKFKYFILGSTLIVFFITLWAFTHMGGEFLPDLEEGDLAMQMTIPPGSSLSQSIESSTKAEKLLLDNFPEVKSVVSKIGTAEVPTDPMAIEDADIMIVLKPKKEWTSASSRDELVAKMKNTLEAIPEGSFEFTQPIQLRFNELMTGVKTDIAIKIFGENLDELFSKANEAATMISGIEGVDDIKVEQITGLPQYVIRYNRNKIARYGINIADLNNLVRTSFAGRSAGVVFEGERRFDLVVRLDSSYRNTIVPENLFIKTMKGNQVPLSEVAEIEFITGPAQISRDDTKRRVTIGINVRNRDIESLVEEINNKLSDELILKPGYYIKYGGAFENLENARNRLKIAVPVALVLILILLFFTFNSVKYALLIFSAVPLSAVGGVIALIIRGMPFSISAGVGFIALFGIAVLNGIVLISYYNNLKKSEYTNIEEVVVKGANSRLRPVMMTAITDVLGFLPMAISVSAGAEVQRPLATVVIGGIITSTMLTMIVLPILFLIINKPKKKFKLKKVHTISSIIILLFLLPVNGISQDTINTQILNEKILIKKIKENNPDYQNILLHVQKTKAAALTQLEIPPAEIRFQKGQINSLVSDYYFSIDQSLGPVLKNIKTIQWNKSRIALAETEMLIMERQFLNNSLLVYNDWIYNYEKLQNLRKNKDFFDDFVNIAKRQYELGEIDVLQKIFLENEYLRLEKEYKNRLLSYNVSENNLKKILMIDENQKIIPDSLLSPSLICLNDSLKSTLIDFSELYFKLIQNNSENIVKLKFSEFFPEISGGYFSQKIDGIPNFTGWQLGISIPLFAIKESNAAKEAKINHEMLNNSIFSQKQKVEAEINTLFDILKNKEVNYTSLWSRGSENIPLLNKTATLSYTNGNISYFEFIQILKTSFELSDEISQAKKDYYNAIINVRFFSPDMDTKH